MSPSASQNGAAHLPSLQMLRAVAAFSVVLFHLSWTGIASFGVELFFVLSGFIISHAAALNPSHFMAKRVARVVPLYWLATCGIALLLLIAPGLLAQTTLSAHSFLSSLFFIPFARGDGEAFPLLFLGWTMNYEMAFYVLFALALWLARGAAPFAAAAALILLVLVHPYVAPWGVAADFWTRPVLLNFVVGIAAYGVWRGHVLPIEKWPVPLVALLALALLTLLIMGASVHFGAAADAYLPMRGLIGGALLLLVLRLDTAMVWPPALLAVGDASYSLYLLHPYLLSAVDRFLHPLGSDAAGVAVSVLAVGLSLLVAMLSYRLVERPANAALRHMLIQRR